MLTIVEQFFDRFGAHLGDKLARIIAHQFAIALVGQKLALFEFRHVTGIDDDVGFEVENFFQLAQAECRASGRCATAVL